MLYYEMTGFLAGHADEDGCETIDLPAEPPTWLLLDFDGTLVDIADTPTGVVVPESLQPLLARAMERLDGRVAIVSGRPVEELEAFLPDFTGTLIGTHGSEMRKDGTYQRLVEYDDAMVSRLHRLANDYAALRPEFLVENKPSGVVLHYRQAEALGALALHFMEALTQAADGFKLQPALMAYEIKPEGVGKDVALAKLLGEGDRAFYAGDDLTDEPALELVQERGGFAIKIGEAPSVASNRLPDPAALRARLERWLA